MLASLFFKSAIAATCVRIEQKVRACYRSKTTKTRDETTHHSSDIPTETLHQSLEAQSSNLSLFRHINAVLLKTPFETKTLQTKSLDESLKTKSLEKSAATREAMYTSAWWSAGSAYLRR
jgi:hypothetical protein